MSDDFATAIVAGGHTHGCTARAGVSIATVSRVMNPVSSVDARNWRRASSWAASELNYTPNTQAQRWSPAEAAFIGRFISEGT